MPWVGSSSSISCGIQRQRGGDLERALAAVGQTDRLRWAREISQADEASAHTAIVELVQRARLPE